MKFDCVVMNPPYQSPIKRKIDTKRGMCGSVIWPKFVEIAFGILKDNGYLCAVHPSNWRRANNRSKNVRQLLKNKDMLYLSMHSIQDGVKIFGATTNYDWYVCQNSSGDKATLVNDFNNKEVELDIHSVDFLPNSNIEKVISLLPSRGEERCEVIHSFSAYETRKKWMSREKTEERCEVLYSRSAYGSDKKWMNREKTEEFKYPCIYSLPQKGMQLFYSTTKNNGHFGVPKVIFSNGAASQVIIDKEGEYGLTQFAYGVADTVENLPKIKQALESEEFIKLCKSFRFSPDKYDYGCIRCFRKDFWKEFV